MSDVSSKVSIVLPTHNGERYLRQSIDSCLNQTYKDLELIIVDDASTDRTPEIVRSYADKRIQYLRQSSNLGLPSALNTGFKASQGDYLTWTSDDNYYTSDAIEVMVNALEKDQRVDFVYTWFKRIDEQGQTVKEEKLKPPKNLAIENCIGGCFLYRRKVYEQIGDYNPSLKLVEDYDYWLRVHKLFSMKRLKKFLYFYRNHSQSLSAGWDKGKIEELVDQVRIPYLTVAQRGYLDLRKAFYRSDYSEAKILWRRCIGNNFFNKEVWRIGVLLYLSPKTAETIRQIKRNITGTRL